MEEYLRQLIDLQNVDKKLDRVRSDLERVPREIEAQLREIENRKAEHLEAEQRLRDVEEEQRECERKKEELISKLAEYKTQLLRLKTNEEYRAMLDQIAYTETKIDEMDSRILELMYSQEEAEADLEESRKNMERGVKRSEKRIDLLREEQRELEEDIRCRTEERDALAEKIKPRYLRKYDQLRLAGKGQVVVGLLHGACGGCMTNVPPQSAVEIKGGAVFTCPICGRFIVWTEDSSFASEEKQ